MASQAREKFATQVNSEILATVRNLAQSEGRQLQALVDEALADLIEKRKQGKPRANVMAAYQASHEKFGMHPRRTAAIRQRKVRAAVYAAAAMGVV